MGRRYKMLTIRKASEIHNSLPSIRASSIDLESLPKQWKRESYVAYVVLPNRKLTNIYIRFSYNQSVKSNENAGEKLRHFDATVDIWKYKLI